MGPRDGLDSCGKSRLPPGFDPRTVHPQPVTIPTELPGPHTSNRHVKKNLKSQHITATQARNSCTTVTFLGQTKLHFPVTVVAKGIIDATMCVPPSGIASVPPAINFRNYLILFHHRFSLAVYVI